MPKLTINTEKKRFPIAPDLYGFFFEDINRAADSGLYPEMLRNRAFDDGEVPEGFTVEGDIMRIKTGWGIGFAGGEGAPHWREKHGLAPTPVPAWYTKDAEMALTDKNTLNDARVFALEAKFVPGGELYNVGYVGIAAEAGKTYHFYVFAKADGTVPLQLSIRAEGKVVASAAITVSGGEYTRYDADLTADATVAKGEFVITAPEGGEVTFGFASLMPAETFRGHGLRKDLAEIMDSMRPGFLRFPGGCVVEGMTVSTMIRFSKTVGPVWERPGHYNIWGYRTTDGLGFHEYLQFAEDMGAVALYVCNCGMTCQGRPGGGAMNEEDTRMALQEVLDALEYARGDVTTKWGALRAKMGHPEPFALRYLEIGNENHGPEYNERYESIRKAVLERWPDLVIIANTHVEKDGLPLDIADEHYYNQTEWFAKSTELYNDYDRSGPDIFVGEFAVVTGPVRTLYPAIGEAMFMIGMERNQDIVKLEAYAPLFENVHYRSWNPNLIAFDNLRSCAIPSFYPWKLFSSHRGKEVVESSMTGPELHSPLYRGSASVLGSAGVAIRGAKWNGEAAVPTHEITGSVQAGDDGFLLVAPEEKQIPAPLKRRGIVPPTLVVMGEDEESRQGVFEMEALVEEGQKVGIGMYCRRLTPQFFGDDHGDPWDARSVKPMSWVIEDGMSSVNDGVGWRPVNLVENIPTALRYGEYNRLRMETDGETLRCFVNDELVAEVAIPTYPAVQAVALDDGDGVIVKLANIADCDQDVEIDLDCDVESAYIEEILTGDPDGRNSLDEPLNICDKRYERTGAARRFVYRAPAYSVSVLILKKA
ncbi:MAG: alpha-L-arabinofuranosidase [Ruminococcaceae bacterium]|nr:alpha-L-arabinofuranosidase [Oscillospiraceae bacterium]